MNDIKNAIADYHNQTRQLIDPLQARIDGLDGKLESALNELAQRADKAPDTVQNLIEPGRYFVNVGGQRLPVLRNSERLASHFSVTRSDNFDLADYVRAGMGIKVQNAVVSGPATVPTSVGASIVDAVRAKSTVLAAGAGTLYVDGPTNLCRIVSDPTVYEHAEGQEDISDSAPVFDAVLMNPTSLVAAVPVSMEVAQDSPNLNDALSASLAAAFASKLDDLALATLLSSSASLPEGSSVGVDTWAGILHNVGHALALNQDIPSALICATSDYIARASETASSAGSWMGPPPVLANMLDLFTSKLNAGTGIMGDFYRGLTIAVRSDLRFEMVRFHQYKAGSHVLVAYLRAGAVVVQPNRLFLAS